MNSKETIKQTEWRVTQQRLRPQEYNPPSDKTYDLYPAHSVGTGKIDIGFDAIADKICNYSTVVVDGYIGVFWTSFRKRLNSSLENKGLRTAWIDVSKAMLSPEEIAHLTKPFLGGDDPIFGTRYDGNLKDFFDDEKLKAIQTQENLNCDIKIVYGCGASLANLEAPLVYVDIPKNELQYRSRAQSVTNLGADTPEEPQKMYKRFYFVDWIILNQHKNSLLPDINWIIDEQDPDSPSIMSGETFRKALHKLSRTNFRVRPWFEPGTWGGQWCKKHIPQLPKDIINYAWSFELITPENGLMFSSDKKLLETTFDWLMYHDNEAVLGDSSGVFGYEFPIRFDFLDTFDGGNLSVQCHPSPEFIKKEFGETFTQDETYYMLDCKPGAKVYIGFQHDIDASEFKKALEQSAEKNTPVEIENFVQVLPAQKHDLFLIPHGTIHCSGIDNMVLEISATPYIFTFKMYDWLRPDLNGKPRPLNIDRAFKNLNFERKGTMVQEELISHPVVTREGNDWQILHLPTHKLQFYDINRYEFRNEIEVDTNGSCHVLSLVEGKSIRLETKHGVPTTYSYAETFVISAAAERYRLINEGDEPVKVLSAFVKKDVSI